MRSGRSKNKKYEVEDRREDLWQETAPPRHTLFPDWPWAHAICIPFPDWWQVEALFCIKLNQRRSQHVYKGKIKCALDLSRVVVLSPVMTVCYVTFLIVVLA